MTTASSRTEPFALSHSFFDVLAAAGVRIRSRLQHGPSGLAVVVVMPDQRHGSIIVSQSDAPDDPVEYLHASIALNTMPTYEDMVLLHHAVFGRRRWAYEVYAPASDHVNLNPTARHLWGRASGEPCMPNFGVFGTI